MSSRPSYAHLFLRKPLPIPAPVLYYENVARESENVCMQDFRCRCGKLLFRGVLMESNVEVKCRKCGFMNEFHGSSLSPYLCLIADKCPRRVVFEGGRQKRAQAVL